MCVSILNAPTESVAILHKVWPVQLMQVSRIPVTGRNTCSICGIDHGYINLHVRKTEGLLEHSNRTTSERAAVAVGCRAEALGVGSRLLIEGDRSRRILHAETSICARDTLWVPRHRNSELPANT